MNDNSPSALGEQQGLRLIRAFLRIHNQADRLKIIKHVESLAEEASIPAAPSQAPPSEHPQDISG